MGLRDVNRLSVARHVLFGAVIGLAVAAIAMTAYCLIHFSPWPEYADRQTGVLRFGVILFIYAAGPLGGGLGVVAGVIAYMVRRKRLPLEK